MHWRNCVLTFQNFGARFVNFLSFQRSKYPHLVHTMIRFQSVTLRYPSLVDLSLGLGHVRVFAYVLLCVSYNAIILWRKMNSNSARLFRHTTYNQSKNIPISMYQNIVSIWIDEFLIITEREPLFMKFLLTQ